MTQIEVRVWKQPRFESGTSDKTMFVTEDEPAHASTGTDGFLEWRAFGGDITETPELRVVDDTGEVHHDGPVTNGVHQMVYEANEVTFELTGWK